MTEQAFNPASASRKAKTDAILRSFHEEQSPTGQGADMQLLMRLGPFARKHWLLMTCGMLLLPVSALASLFQPRLMKRAIDAAVVTHDEAALSHVVMLFVVAIAFEFAARFLQIYTLQLGGQRIVADLRQAVFLHVQRLRIGYFDRTPVGRVVTRMTNDVDSLGELFASGAVTAIGDVLMLVGIVGFMLSLDWRLSLIAFAALPPLVIAIEVIRRYMRTAYRAIRARTAQLNAYLSEQVQGISIVQAFGKEDACAAEYSLINAEYRNSNRLSIRYDALLYSIVESVAAACVALVLYYAGVRAGLLSAHKAAAYVGTVVAVYEYIQRFFTPIRDLSTKYTIVQQSLAAAERIFGLLDTHEFDAPDGLPTEPPLQNDSAILRFENVSFAYRENSPVLRDVSFTVAPGEKVAIVGATGAGKTTVTALLLRLYERTAGVIRLHGKDIRSLEREELRRNFAVVQQDVFLFGGDVLSNVALGDETPSRERVTEALQRVGVLPMLQSRGEDPLAVRVEASGANFSAGERQLLAFARALYRNPEVLVLDEATANIDSETESKLQHAVDEVLRERTAIIIAHRLSTIRRATRILVFHKGEIVEEGTHEALLEKAGIYARLHALQFGGE